MMQWQQQARVLRLYVPTDKQNGRYICCQYDEAVAQLSTRKIWYNFVPFPWYTQGTLHQRYKVPKPKTMVQYLSHGNHWGFLSSFSWHVPLQSHILYHYGTFNIHSVDRAKETNLMMSSPVTQHSDQANNVSWRIRVSVFIPELGVTSAHFYACTHESQHRSI